MWGIAAAIDMIGYSIAGLFFGHFGSVVSPLKLIFGGLLGCCSSYILLAVCQNMYFIIVVRFLDGVGCSSLMILAPSIIDAIAPREKRATWLAIFCASTPVGFALGPAITGVVLSMGHHWWRSVFFVLSGTMLPLVLIVFCIPYTDTMKDNCNEEAGAVKESANSLNSVGLVRVKDELCILLRKRTFVFNVLTYTMQTFWIGITAAIGVKYLEIVYKFSTSQAGISLGCCILLCGLLGTLSGGWLVDYFKRKRNLTKEAEFVVVSTRVTFVFSSLALPPSIFIIFSPSHIPALGFVFLFFTIWFVFTTLGPLNQVTLWTSPTEFRPFAISLQMFCIHFLGDGISPIISGFVIEETKADWGENMSNRFGMAVANVGLVVSVLFAGLAWRSAKHDLLKLKSSETPDAES
eukprot:906707_1